MPKCSIRSATSTREQPGREVDYFCLPGHRPPTLLYRLSGGSESGWLDGRQRKCLPRRSLHSLVLLAWCEPSNGLSWERASQGSGSGPRNPFLTLSRSATRSRRCALAQESRSSTIVAQAGWYRCLPSPLMRGRPVSPYGRNARAGAGLPRVSMPCWLSTLLRSISRSIRGGTPAGRLREDLPLFLTPQARVMPCFFAGLLLLYAMEASSRVTRLNEPARSDGTSFQSNVRAACSL